jgi:hypothetical protein
MAEKGAERFSTAGIHQMTIGKFIITMGLGLAVSFLVACVYAFSQWDGDKPIVITSSELESPSKDWIATQETVDNGLGFGQGMVYDEVHIRAPNETISNHGDRAESTVFYIEAMGASGEPPRLIWRDSTHLIISYDGSKRTGNGPGKGLTNFHGISIEYRPVPRK